MVDRTSFMKLLCILLCSACVSSTKDFIALKTEIGYLVGGELFTEDFVLTHKQVPHWRRKCAEITQRTGVRGDLLLAGVQERLQNLAYPDYIFDEKERAVLRIGTEIYSHQASQLLYAQAFPYDGSLLDRDEKYFWLDPPKQSNHQCTGCAKGNETGPVHDIKRHLYPEKHGKPSWLPYYLRGEVLNNSTLNQFGSIIAPTAPIIFYQTIGANTGGTTAMLLLHRAVLDLGYHTIICNETNRFESACTTPQDSSLVITGEWCHEVFAEYALNPTPGVPLVSPDEVDRMTIEEVGFKGRGVQYYLGFHHGQDSCRGTSALTDCHYLSKSLGWKGLSAYYLGCAMSDPIKDAVGSLLTTHVTSPVTPPATLEALEGASAAKVLVDGGIEWRTQPAENVESEENTSEESEGVLKEDLILVDPDFFRDYPPLTPIKFGVPPGYKGVMVQDFTKQQMPLLLQRAKIVLDLAMPGPERLSTEGILMGCIPIISNRWTGASNIDYPGVHRVDHTNATEIYETIKTVAENYESELRSVQNAQFYKYALSMWNKVHNTADVVMGSSYLHFALYAKNLQEEYIATFQILALLYLFPLCSVDLYVADEMWFIRHHYAFFENLQHAGYIRTDPYDPTEFTMYTTEYANRRSYVRVKSIHTYTDYVGNNSGVLNENSVYDSPLTPSWVSVLIVLPIGVVFQNPLDLLSVITHIPHNEYRYVNYIDRLTGDNVSVLVVAPYCTVENITQPMQSILYAQLATNVENSPRMGDGSITLPTTESICSLYKATVAATTNCIDIIYGITNTPAWQSNKIIASSLGFTCN